MVKNSGLFKKLLNHLDSNYGEDCIITNMNQEKTTLKTPNGKVIINSKTYELISSEKFTKIGNILKNV